MNHIHNANKFLEYIKTPLTPEMITSLYSSCNISYERCLLYHDFIQSLVAIVFDTYLGDDVTDEEFRIKHFEWAWGKNVNNFKSENIHFNSTNELYNYFLDFFIETFYSVQNKDGFPTLRPNLTKLWSYLFNSNVVKTRSDIDMLIEIYTLFSKSLEKM
jgi:hypothetical protein